jgi:hypothetical protein
MEAQKHVQRLLACSTLSATGTTTLSTARQGSDASTQQREDSRRILGSMAVECPISLSYDLSRRILMNAHRKADVFTIPVSEGLCVMSVV